MSINNIEAFKDCYIMQRHDIERFAATLADGFSQYALFEYISGGEYNYEKMHFFWEVSLALLPDNAICIADSKEANSVLIYLQPHSMKANTLAYVKAGGLKWLTKFGLKSIIRLMRFEIQTQRVYQQHRAPQDGYLMAFATRIDKQGQHYGKPLMQALLNYLDANNDRCYLETLKAKNVDLYKHFAFQLEECIDIQMGGLTIYVMHR